MGPNGTGNSLSTSVIAVAVDGAGNGYIAGSAGYGIPPVPVPSMSASQ